MRYLITAIILLAASHCFSAIMDNPVTVPVGFHAYMDADPYGEIEVALNGTEVDGVADSSGGEFETNYTTTLLKPGKEYTVEVSAKYLPTYIVYFNPPLGYKVYIEGLRCDQYEDSDDDEFMWPPTEFTIKIVGGSGNGFHARAGESTSIAPGKVIWRVALGSLHNGDSAGNLVISESSLPSTIYEPGGLYLDYKNEEVEVIRSSGDLRQIRTNQALVDIQTISSTSYRIWFYHRDAYEADTNPNPLYTIKQGKSPYLKYTISKPGTDKFRIEKIEDGYTSVTDVDRNGGYWLLDDWRKSTTTAMRQVDQSAASGATYKETTKNESGTTATEYEKTFTSYAWGSELTKREAESGTQVASTTYAYETSTSNKGSYAKLKWMVEPGGKWTRFEHYTSGRISKVYRPYLSVHTDPSTATETKCITTEYFSTFDSEAQLSRPSRIEESYPRYNSGWEAAMTGKTVLTYGDETRNSHKILIATRSDYSYASSLQTTYQRKYYENVSDSLLRNRIDSIHRPDGTIESHVWQRGTFDSSSGDFDQTDESGGDSRHVVITGKTVVGSADLMTFDSYDIYDLDLVVNGSIRYVSVRDENALVVRSEQWVYTNSGWEEIGWREYDFDLSNRLLSRTSHNNTVDSFEYDSSNYADGQVTTITDFQGVESEFAYDNAGRISSRTILGEDGWTIETNWTIEDQDDTVETYTYDGAGRVIQSVRGTASTVTYKTTYDKADRVTETSVPKPGGSYFETSYEYSGRTVDITHPDGGTTKREYFYDGTPYKVTGTAQPTQYYHPWVNPDGSRIVAVRHNSTTADGWDWKIFDWLERYVVHFEPTFDTDVWSEPLRTYYTYDTTGLLIAEHVVNNMTTRKPDKRYFYDDMGSLATAYEDRNDNGLMDSGGIDGIEKYKREYNIESGDVWLETSTKIHAQHNETTQTALERKKVRLTGFATGVISETKIYDLKGNETKIVVKTESGKRLMTETKTPGASNEAITYRLNGRLVWQRTPQGVITQINYDDHGRVVKRIGRSSVYEETVYYSNTDFVEKLKNADSTTSTLSYDSGGRVATITDSLGNVTRNSYTAMGKLEKTWGSGVSQPAEFLYNSYGWLTKMHTWQNVLYSDAVDDFGGTSWPSSPGTPKETEWVYHGESGLVEEKIDPSAAGNSVEFDYNAIGQLIKETLSRSTDYKSYSYFSVATTGDSKGSNLLKKINYSDSTPDVEFTYTRTGKFDTVKDFTASTYPREFVYRDSADGDLQLTQEQLGEFYGTTGQGNTQVISRAYDSGTGVDGRLIAFAYGQSGYEWSGTGSSSKNQTNYSYNSQEGRISAITYYEPDLTAYSFTYGYESGSNLVNSVDDFDDYARDTYWQSSRDQKYIVDTFWDGLSFAKYTYSTDDEGRRTGQKLTGSINNSTDGLSNGYGHQTDYTYTTRGTLEYTDSFELNSSYNPTTTVVAGRHRVYSTDSTDTYNSGWDASGNRVIERQSPSDMSKWKAYYRGAINNYTSSTGHLAETFATDNDGNLTADGSWTYTYDAENRLVQMASKSGNPEHPMTLRFRYDFLDRRVEKKVFPNTTATGTPDFYTKFVYDGWNLIAELDGNDSNDVIRTYTWGLDESSTVGGAGGVGGLLMMREGSKRYYPAFDANGNMTGFRNESDKISAAYEYDAFGNVVNEVGTTAATDEDPQLSYGSGAKYNEINPIGFATKYTDRETGLVYFGMRFYNPKTGRFLNRDPIGEAGGRNLYNYLSNDPVNRIDFLGMAFSLGVPAKEIVERNRQFQNEKWQYFEGSSDTPKDDEPKIVLPKRIFLDFHFGGKADRYFAQSYDTLFLNEAADDTLHEMENEDEFPTVAAQRQQGFWSTGGNRDAALFGGVGRGFKGAFTETWSAIKNYDETYDSVLKLGGMLKSDFFGTVGGMAGGLLDQVKTPGGRGEIYGGVAAGVVTLGGAWLARGSKAIRSADDLLKWTGPGSTLEKVPGGSDLIIRSANGTKQIRFDISNPHGLDPHINVETFKARNLYPGDRKMIQTGNDHIFPKP